MAVGLGELSGVLVQVELELPQEMAEMTHAHLSQLRMNVLDCSLDVLVDLYFVAVEEFHGAQGLQVLGLEH